MGLLSRAVPLQRWRGRRVSVQRLWQVRQPKARQRVGIDAVDAGNAVHAVHAVDEAQAGPFSGNT